jgi:Uma2 family endonuclease
MEAPDISKKYTYADYLLWTIEERLELIRGHVFRMSPAPSRKHQEISREIFGQLWLQLKNNPCKPFSAPFDVRLPRPGQTADEDILTVVQPDLCVICDSDKLDDRGCLGPPDLIIEILSPGNSEKEMRQKFSVYEEAGVREYWLVDPAQEAVFVYILNEEGRFIGQQPHVKSDVVPVRCLPGVEIRLADVFSSGA